MARLLPDEGGVLEIYGFLQTDGTVLLTLNDAVAGTFDFAEMVEDAIESTEHVETVEAALEDLEALRSHLSAALEKTAGKVAEVNAIRDSWVDVGREATDAET